jgi:hypothetical protein
MKHLKELNLKFKITLTKIQVRTKIIHSRVYKKKVN